MMEKKELFRQTLFMMFCTAAMAGLLTYGIQASLPGSGLSEYDRGGTSAVIPIVVLFTLMYLGAFIASVLEWCEKA